MQNNYSMNNINNFIDDYQNKVLINEKNLDFKCSFNWKKVIRKNNTWTIKNKVFKEQYNKTLNGEILQEKFISDMTPILNDFYKEKNRTRKY